MQKQPKFGRIFFILSLGIFFATRLIGLTKLPVFADEAIYIRWAQVAFNQPQKYLFLPMLDGKPPLHPWILIPFIETLPDPLWASRFVSVLAGAITLIMLLKTTVILGGFKKELLATTVIITATPFWFFHQRLGIAESLLTMWFAMALYYSLRLIKKTTVTNFILVAISVGGALWTKTTALFFIPTLAAVPLLAKSSYKQKNTRSLLLAGFIGCGLFLLLKLSPLFPSLFSRSLDYTFSAKELIAGEWKYVTFQSLPRIIGWVLWYFTPALFALITVTQRESRILLLMTFFYALPLIIGGRVLSPRYFMPAAVPFTLALVMALKTLNQKPNTVWLSELILLVVSLIGSVFIIVSTINPNKLPLVEFDRVAYLTEWSSGHGIPEVRDFIKTRIKETKVTVATEGSFGTLPDGLLMYFDHTPYIQNLTLFGAGHFNTQVIESLAQTAITRETYIVVNQDRLTIDPLPTNVILISSYPRPYNGSPLLLFRIYPQS